jgi:RNA polymerase sigma-70 factor, ECF subfamily
MAPQRADEGSGFFEKYYDRIYVYLRGMLRDSNEAEDMAQETFLRAHNRRDTLKDPGAMLSWLYSIATRVALDRLRQRAGAAARESAVDVAEIDPPDPGQPSLEQGLEQTRMSACVNRFVIGLPDTYRAVLLLHDTNGLTGSEIAALLEIPLATVKIRLHRARRKLKAALEDGCTFTCDSRGVLVCEPKK